MGGVTRAIALTGSDQAAQTVPGWYRGFAIRETAGSTAVVDIYDNASAASGTRIDTISLAANESAREHYDPGIKTDNGIWVEIVSGAVAGSVRVG